MTDVQQKANMARQRGYIYGLLAELYRAEPGRELLEKLKGGEFLETFKDAGIEFDEDFIRKPIKELTEELAVEYTRLFLGPGTHIYPHESAYINKEQAAVPHAATQIKALIERLGFRG